MSVKRPLVDFVSYQTKDSAMHDPAEIETLVDRCRASGNIVRLLKAACPTLSDDDAQRLSERLPLRIRKPSQKARKCNSFRADFIADVKRETRTLGSRILAFEKVYPKYSMLPNGRTFFKQRAWALLEKPSEAVRKILQERKSQSCGPHI